MGFMVGRKQWKKKWQDLRYRDIPFYELVERLIQLFRLNEERPQPGKAMMKMKKIVYRIVSRIARLR